MLPILIEIVLGIGLLGSLLGLRVVYGAVRALRKEYEEVVSELRKLGALPTSEEEGDPHEA